jgi:hypothetical protein
LHRETLARVQQREIEIQARFTKIQSRARAVASQALKRPVLAPRRDDDG